MGESVFAQTFRHLRQTPKILQMQSISFQRVLGTSEDIARTEETKELELLKRSRGKKLAKI